jgi:hypothetical protein
MTFKQYLDKRKTKPFVWAKQNEVNHVLVWRAYTGKRVSARSAMLLSALCAGKVSKWSFVFPEED